MKTLILVGDGMGDRPCPELDGKTPLQAADIPHMRRIAAAGSLFLADTVPPGFPPGSDVANMGLLGYDAREVYSGRAPIEAAGAGIALRPEDVAFRCNLVHIADDIMVDYSAGHISTEEATPLIEALEAELGGDGLHFHAGVQYRHLLVWGKRSGRPATQPPHDILEQSVPPHLPRGEGADAVLELMERSKEVLAGHPVNLARAARGDVPVTQIWLWGQGPAMQLPGYRELYGLTGTVITAVDLVRGAGRAGRTGHPGGGGCHGLDRYQLRRESSSRAGRAGDPGLRVCARGGARRVRPCGRRPFKDRGHHRLRPSGCRPRSPRHGGTRRALSAAGDHGSPHPDRNSRPQRGTRSPGHVGGAGGDLVEETAFDEFIHGGRTDIRTYEWIPGWLRGEA